MKLIKKLLGKLSFKIFAFLYIVFGAISLLILGISTANNGLFAQYVHILIKSNWAMVSGLAMLVLYLIIRLIRDYRANVFGSRLMLRLMMMFAGIGLIPGVLLYQMSMQFLSRSIDSWYNVRVENSLNSSLALGRAVFNDNKNNILLQTKSIAQEIQTAQNWQNQNLDALRTKFRVFDLLLLDSKAQPLQAARANPTLIFSPLSQEGLQALYAEGQYVTIDTIGGENFVRVVLALGQATESSLFGKQYRYFLQVLQPIPRDIAVNAEEVQREQREYQEFLLAREGLRQLFIKTLQIAFAYFTCLAIIIAFALSRKLSKPLRYLSHGTKAVAAGDFSQIATLDTKDELGILTKEFSQMTRQLEDARQTVEKKQHDLNQAKDFLEKILASLSTGVLVFDEQFMLWTYNQGAERILDINLAALIGFKLNTNQHLESLLNEIQRCFKKHAAFSHRMFWQEQITLTLQIPQQEPRELSLLMRGSYLTLDVKTGHVVVFDDISQVASAQRAIAWSEVARRLAHEIKNPLTPIQLSAERLAHKLSSKLTDTDRAMLERATTTIVNQVTAMKRMVDDFREYAKTTQQQHEPIDLNALIKDVIQLYGGAENPLFTLQLTEQPLVIEGDATHLRQVLHNLLQNAQDALIEQKNPNISITTDLITNTTEKTPSNQQIKLIISDNGQGFNAKLLDKVFEPYITTKAHGTGLGLAIVKKIIEAHKGQIELSNRYDKDGKIQGATVYIVFM